MDTLEKQKSELGLSTVVETATKEGETWIMGIHDFGAYFKFWSSKRRPFSN